MKKRIVLLSGGRTSEEVKKVIKRKAVKMVKVYIASPYTKGDVAVNVKVQIDMADKLMTLGYTPFVPLLTHFQHLVHPRPYEDWLKNDIDWLLSCNVLLRLPGESSGADREIKIAQMYGIPVVYSVDELNDLVKVRGWK